MKTRKLAVEGALEFTPQIYRDHRGLFLSPYQEATFLTAHHKPLFPVAQTNHSESHRGVVRGIHYTLTPPGTAKYVYCPRGEALDIVIDIRVGSPTFGQWDAVLLDQQHYRTMYFPIGVGHAFIALTDNTVMSYMLSSTYVPHHELALSALDPALALPIPHDIQPILSHRDQIAPTLAQAAAAGTLPNYHQCQITEQQLHQNHHLTHTT